MASKSIEQPTLGAIVLYVDRNDGMIAPAIVTEVLTGAVRLTTFQPGMVPFPVPQVVRYDFDGARERGTWYWPARTRST